MLSSQTLFRCHVCWKHLTLSVFVEVLVGLHEQGYS